MQFFPFTNKHFKRKRLDLVDSIDVIPQHCLYPCYQADYM